jgi:anti-sigma B factor antagonist
VFTIDTRLHGTATRRGFRARFWSRNQAKVADPDARLRKPGLPAGLIYNHDVATQLRITQRHFGDVTVLDLDGRLEIGDGDIELTACVDGLIREGRLKVIVNLRDVVHIDSGGLGALLTKHISLRKRGGDLKLLHLTDSAHRALSVTRVLTVVDAFHSETEAIGSFGSTTGTS